ncbi:MAG TPA: hypothetical protein VGV61_14670 [Thermoanaerobaculia bacterium]|nr:hypothetical protein [Thermoanaerobaculia bacterium]
MTLLLAFLLAGMANAAPSAPAVSCRLETVAPLRHGGPAVVRLTLANGATRPKWALRWNTPFEGAWLGTIFTLVGPDSQEVRYQGARVKRGEPDAGDYVELPASGAVTATADLATAYDLSRPGRYELTVSGALLDVTSDRRAVPRPRDRHRPAALRCAPLRFELP